MFCQHRSPSRLILYYLREYDIKFLSPTLQLGLHPIFVCWFNSARRQCLNSERKIRCRWISLTTVHYCLPDPPWETFSIVKCLLTFKTSIFWKLSRLHCRLSTQVIVTPINQRHQSSTFAKSEHITCNTRFFWLNPQHLPMQPQRQFQPTLIVCLFIFVQHTMTYQHILECRKPI